MKATGDQTCIVTNGDGTPHEFSYYTYTAPGEYPRRLSWVRDHIGLYGRDYYYSQGKWWFKDEIDLLTFLLKYGNE